jgi:hypothetical protein
MPRVYRLTAELLINYLEVLKAVCIAAALKADTGIDISTQTMVTRCHFISRIIIFISLSGAVVKDT